MNYDVMVIGGGIAGTTATATLQAMGHTVVLIERRRFDEIGSPQPEWITQQALDSLNELNINCVKCLGAPFTGAVFHSADFARTAVSEAKEPPAFRVDYTTLIEQLDKVLRDRDVSRIDGATPSRIEPGEDHVTAVFDNRDPVEAKFLVMADGAGNTDDAGPDETLSWIAEAQIATVAPSRDQQMHWVLGLDGGRSLAAWWFDKSFLVAQFHGVGTRSELTQRLIDLLADAVVAKALAGKVTVNQGGITWRLAPARSALEFDSHVGKRSLRIGDAGGFFSAVSREGICPAIRSAHLAGEVISEALKSRHPQDALSQFNARWRIALAEYLRLPNADVQFLLPLIFTNQPIADRMAAACWHGENI